MRTIDADKLKKDISRLHTLNDEAEIRRAYELNPHSTMADFEDTLVSVFDAIDSAPTIDAVSEWIPCSERLPSEQGQYLVTTYAYNDYYYVDTLSFHKGKFYETDDEWGDIVDNDVVAWMPLPKPYGERKGE